MKEIIAHGVRGMDKKLILASKSKIRSTLLQQAGYRFEQETSAVDESKVLGSNPIELSVNRAKAKASAVSVSNPNSFVIGADQVLVFEGRIFSKAKDLNEARDHLSKLSGAEHQLVSSLAVVDQQGGVSNCLTSTATANLRMRPLSAAMIDRYLSFDEWQGCVGCYQYENRGINLFDSVSGNESTILGLPMLELVLLLRQAGVCVI